jgi:acyl carrier protein phosphodiesterase
MNYLAHSYLAAGSDEFLLGSFLGDFVKGKVDRRYGNAIEQGIVFHRKVDGFADQHDLTAACRSLFSPQQRRFAGITVDICFDHFLSRHWDTYAPVELGDFAEHVYTVMQNYNQILPPRLQAVLPRMRYQNWLVTYGTLDGVRITLERISKRVSQKNPLKEAIEEVNANYDDLERHFLAFFPDLIDFTRHYCAAVNYPSALLPDDGIPRDR